jgi:hypothetical protein
MAIITYSLRRNKHYTAVIAPFRHRPIANNAPKYRPFGQRKEVKSVMQPVQLARIAKEESGVFEEDKNTMPRKS